MTALWIYAFQHCDNDDDDDDGNEDNSNNRSYNDSTPNDRMNNPHIWQKKR